MKSFNEFNNFFSTFFLTAISFLLISAWISILIIRSDFSNLLISATFRSHIRFYSISKKFSINCCEKIDLVYFALRKTCMFLMIQFNSLSFFFLITSWRIISNIDTSKSFNVTSEMMLAHTIFLSTRNVILIITWKLLQTFFSSFFSLSFISFISNDSKDMTLSDTSFWTRIREFWREISEFRATRIRRLREFRETITIHDINQDSLTKSRISSNSTNSRIFNLNQKFTRSKHLIYSSSDFIHDDLV
jgi:hypothetical protein